MLNNQLKPILVAVLGTIAIASAAQAADDIKLDKVEVVGITPLHSSGTPINDVPSNVQVVNGKDLETQQSIGIADYMSNNMLGVNVNETSNNPYEPEVNFHGFTASPLLGTPQGMSIYQDGVRVNAPFGDVVNWDLIPKNAIAGINLMPGSNPLFGLNTLGGALSIQTKSGDTNPGASAQVYGGSWGRYAAEAEYGGSTENGLNFFVAGNYFKEDGWRDTSSTEIQQLFTKVGWKGEKADFNVSLALADNTMNGNGYQAESLMNSLGRASAYTAPDTTKNKLGALTGQYNYWVNDNLALNTVAYYRHVTTKTYGVNTAGNDWADAGYIGEVDSTSSKQNSYGVTAQINYLTEKNQLIVGAGYDRADIDFGQTSQGFTAFTTSDRNIAAGLTSVDPITGLPALAPTSLSGTTTTWSLFGTDTYKVTPKIALTASGRYNHTTVDNHDNLIPDSSDPNSLTAKNTFQRFNPAIGLTFTPVQSLNFFAGYNEGSRAPTSVELGCASEVAPCKLPNSMAGDPPLKQVVARTFEGGVRGRMSDTVKWSMSAYTTQNENDIQFIAANTSGVGYFSNVGDTRRSGIDLGLNLTTEKSRWMLGYSFVKATYETDFYIHNAQQADRILVSAGSYIPGIPQHQLKLRTEYNVLPNWQLGATALAYSDQYMRGNESNTDPNGKVAGYAILNLDTRYTFSNTGWQAFAKVNNVFDTDFASGGMLGQTQFLTSGLYNTGAATNDRFLAPGAPRAGWVGLRYELPGAKATANVDRD